MPSAPGTRSAPTPLLESTCTVMPASSIDLNRRSPISGRSSIGLALPGATFRPLKWPRLATASGLTYLDARAGTVKCSSSATTRMDGFPPGFQGKVVAFIVAGPQARSGRLADAPGADRGGDRALIAAFRERSVRD